MPRHADITTLLHPDDLKARIRLGHDLRAGRRKAGLTQAEVAEAQYLSTRATGSVEHLDGRDPLIPTVQRQARAFGCAVRFRLHHVIAARSLPAYPHLPPDGADAQHRADLLQQLVTVRRELGLRQVDAGARMGVTARAVSNVEAYANEPLLSTYQRYARALGGRLAFRVVEAPVVDHVLVARAVEGRATFADLSDAERFTLLRDHGGRFPTAEWQRRLHASHSAVHRWLVLAEQVAA